MRRRVGIVVDVLAESLAHAWISKLVWKAEYHFLQFHVVARTIRRLTNYSICGRQFHVAASTLWMSNDLAQVVIGAVVNS